MLVILLLIWILLIIILRANNKIIFGIPIGFSLLVPLLLLANHPKIAFDLINLIYWLFLAAVLFCLNIRKTYQKKENYQNYEIFKGKKKIILFCLCFLIPFVIIFHNFFLNTTLSTGDAPFFYPENLKELFYKPILWNYRNENFGQDQSNILWLYLPTFLFGLLNHFLGLNSQLLIRLIFYFPAALLSFFGTWIFLNLWTNNSISKFLASFLYCFNTYFLMLIDGGQIGIALAYGFFPISAYFLFKFFENTSLKFFLLALIFLFIISNIDLRILLILLLFVFFYFFIGKMILRKFKVTKKMIILSPILLISLFLLDSFWLIPLTLNLYFKSGYNVESSSLNLINLLDSFYLFQPHFPLNEFGKIFPPPYYFGFIPLILFLWIFNSSKLKKGLSLSLLFFIFAFLAKGIDKPFGEIYDYFIKTIPLGFAFRDSSKFFIPLLLTASLLFSLTIDSLGRLNKRIYFISITLIYCYLLILIYPAFFGGLSGTLGYQKKGLSFKTIYQNIHYQKGFFRTLWFSERLSLAYSDWQKPALSANTLYQERPFASMIEGEYDLFNYLHNNQLIQWLNLIGVKYILFPENERKKSWTDKEIDERKLFLQFIDGISFFKKVDWETSFPIYQVEPTLPKIFAQRKIFLVLGGEEIYQNLIKNNNFKLANQGFIFLEDGKEDPNLFLSLSKNSADIIFENKTALDLSMVFLKEKMISVFQDGANEWAKRSSNEYLKWKSELSEHGIKFFEFDYGKGVAFSTIKDEKLNFKLNTPKNYYLAIRYTNSLDGNGLQLTVDQNKKTLRSNDPKHFKWEIFGPLSTDKNNQKIEIMNMGGTAAINTLAILSQDDIKVSNAKAFQLIKNINGLEIKDKKDWEDLGKKLEKNFLFAEYREIDPTEYRVKVASDANWLVFTDHFNPGWELKSNKSNLSLPFYSMINGFYISEDSKKDYDLVYSSEQQVNIGIILSLISLVTIASISAIIYLKGKMK